MPMRDYYLTLSGLTSAGGVPGIQSITTAVAGATVSTWANSPFDTGLQISSEYGQSPYQTANLNAIKATIGQSPQKFFYLVQAATKFSATITTSLILKLMQNTTAGSTGRTSAFVSQTFLMKDYAAAVYTTCNPILCKIPLPEPLQRYINGIFIVGAASTGGAKLAKVMAELTLY